MTDTAGPSLKDEDSQAQRRRLARLLGQILADLWLRERATCDRLGKPEKEPKKSGT